MKNFDICWRCVLSDDFNVSIGLAMRVTDIQGGRSVESISPRDVCDNLVVEHCIYGILMGDIVFVCARGKFNSHFHIVA